MLNYHFFGANRCTFNAQFSWVSILMRYKSYFNLGVLVEESCSLLTTEI